MSTQSSTTNLNMNFRFISYAIQMFSNFWIAVNIKKLKGIVHFLFRISFKHLAKIIWPYGPTVGFRQFYFKHLEKTSLGLTALPEAIVKILMSQI